MIVDSFGNPLTKTIEDIPESKIPQVIEIPNRVEDIYPLTIIRLLTPNKKNILILNLLENSFLIANINSDFPEDSILPEFPEDVFWGLGKTIDEAFLNYLENINIYLVARS